jgi:hypothetical protein
MRTKRHRQFSSVVCGLFAVTVSAIPSAHSESALSGSLNSVGAIDFPADVSSTSGGNAVIASDSEASSVNREKALAAEEAKLLSAIEEKSGSAVASLSTDSVQEAEPKVVVPENKKAKGDTSNRARAATRSRPGAIAASSKSSTTENALIKKVSLSDNAGLVEYDLAVEEFEDYYRDLDEAGVPGESMKDFVDTTVEGVSNSAVEVDSEEKAGQLKNKDTTNFGAVKVSRVVETVPVDKVLNTGRVANRRSTAKKADEIREQAGSGIGSSFREGGSLSDKQDRSAAVVNAETSSVSGSIRALSEELARLRAENRRYHSELESLQREYQSRNYQGGATKPMASTSVVATSQAIVGFDYSPVYTGPGRQFSRLMHMQRGDSVVVEYQDGEWIRVNVADGVRAWMRASDIGR